MKGRDSSTDWKVLRYFNHGYSVDCGYCLTTWRGVAASQEAAERYLFTHQLIYCTGIKRDHKPATNADAVDLVDGIGTK